ncbi:MAG: hypothetical protein AAFQ37_07150 [Bacteroidota bacterium]
MTNHRAQQWKLEITWGLFAIILTILVLLPVYFNRIPFPFYVQNAVYVVAAITITRYLFFLPISWIRERYLIQGGFAFLMIPLVFWMVWGLNQFITYLDNEGPDVLVRHLSGDFAGGMNAYLRTEYFFFGIWASVAGGILPFRIIYYVWSTFIKRGRKR